MAGIVGEKNAFVCGQQPSSSGRQKGENQYRASS
jgi:hypothetical protein